jgi:hypothetical protein
MPGAWFLSLLLLTASSNALAEESLLDDPAMRASFAELVRDSGYGWWHTEEAAFVVRNANGGYRLVVWDTEREYQKRSFNGTIPRAAVAIVHTHPRDKPEASRGDRQTARLLAMPVVVLTPLNIVVVGPDGRSVAVVRNQRWLPSADPSAP